MRNEASAISGRSIFKIPDGKCAGIQICPQRTNSPAGILCHFREKYRKQHKIQNNNECLKTVNSAARVSSIKVVKSCLRQKPELKEAAAAWFHDKWGVPQEAYLECMKAYINNETEYGWYLCLDSGRIAGGLGVIENDFHDRKDLAPNVCAVYTEKEYRCQGIAGQLLDIVVKDMKSKGITPIYLITDHTSFYERYGWEFLCMVQGDNEPDMTRMYIHR